MSYFRAVLLLFVVQIAGLLAVFLLMEVGPESTMKNWIPAFTIPSISAVFLYHYLLHKKQYKKITVLSLLNLFLITTQLYIYVEILKWDIGFGFIILLLVSLLAPLNYQSIKFFNKSRNTVGQ